MDFSHAHFVSCCFENEVFFFVSVIVFLPGIWRILYPGNSCLLCAWAEHAGACDQYDLFQLLSGDASCLVLFSWLAFAQKSVERVRFRKQKGGLFSLILLLVFLAGTLGLIRVGKNPETGEVAMEGLPLSVQAVISLASGEAQDYHVQLLERETLYQNESLADVRVEPLKEKPYLLFQQDVTEAPNNWVNQAVAKYYHKESVALSGSTG